jgi:hypothetical protein
MRKDSFWWIAPEYFSRWRLFPRAFITMYIYLLWRVVEWFMALPEPSMEQAGLVSVIVGAGAAWFGLYVNSSSSTFVAEVDTRQTGSMSGSTKLTTKEKRDREEYNDYEDRF